MNDTIHRNTMPPPTDASIFPYMLQAGKGEGWVSPPPVAPVAVTF